MGLAAMSLITMAAYCGAVGMSLQKIHGYAVEPVRSVWAGQEVCCLTVSSDPNIDGLLSVSHPEHPVSRVLSEMEDPHGVLGVWPSAYVAAANIPEGTTSLLELGAGAGLPSLVASVLYGARVVATDVEELPLQFLRVAWEAHPERKASTFETRLLDVREVDADLLTNFECVVAADILYYPDVAAKLGACMAEARRRRPSLSLVVCDPGRRGRDDFLAAFNAAKVSNLAYFRDEAVPATSPRLDIFDGSPQQTVGILDFAP